MNLKTLIRSAACLLAFAAAWAHAEATPPEVKIPRRVPANLFRGFAPGAGAKLALDVRVNDADTSHERFKMDPVDGNPAPSDPTKWTFLVLGK